MELAAYLDRIGLDRAGPPTLETLKAVHAAHAAATPFENLDVQLGRPLTTSVEAAFDKLVNRRRGGWCYENNGVLGWALGELGFDVTRVSAGVMREAAGDFALGNHLCLLVRLDQPWLADVGFGGSLAAPIPLATGTRDDAPYRLTLSRLEDGHWRFAEQAHGNPFSFDFRAEAAEEALFDAKCAFLQSDADSPFVQNMVVQQRQGDVHVSLRGRVIQRTASAGVEKRILDSADELVATLSEVFALDMPEAATLWPAICARHEAVFGEKVASA